jgi:arsenical pump membrane protein
LDELGELGPTIGFLAAVLVLAELCEREGLFQAAGRRMAGASKGRPVALLGLVFVVGAAVTAALSLDATVVLLTPVVFQTAVRLRLRPKPHVYACTHLANSASLLLPVSNLTNLLAFRASTLSFARFATIMALPWLAVIGVEWLVLPWLAVIGVEWLVLRRFFASDLVGRGEVIAEREPGGAPRTAVVVLALTLLGFGLASLVHLDPAVIAAAGALALAVPALRGGRARPSDLGRAVALPFLAFVAALGLVVRGVSDAGLGGLVARLVPSGNSLWSLLAVAVLAAVLANLANNLPAILLLLPAAAAGGPGTVLAALLGVNLGPNLTRGRGGGRRRRPGGSARPRAATPGTPPGRTYQRSVGRGRRRDAGGGGGPGGTPGPPGRTQRPGRAGRGRAGLRRRPAGRGATARGSAQGALAPPPASSSTEAPGVESIPPPPRHRGPPPPHPPPHGAR